MPIRLKPTYVVERVTNINLEELSKDGIKGLIFDLDNTLMPPKNCNMPEDIKLWIENAKKDFKIAVLSNNPNCSYVKEAGEKIGCIAFSKAAKPGIKAASEALRQLGLTNKEVVMVGDRPLTDIWVGERLHIITILVDPIMKHQEPKPIKFLRKLERLFVLPPKKYF